MFITTYVGVCNYSFSQLCSKLLVIKHLPYEAGKYIEKQTRWP